MQTTTIRSVYFSHGYWCTVLVASTYYRIQNSTVVHQLYLVVFVTGCLQASQPQSVPDTQPNKLSSNKAMERYYDYDWWFSKFFNPRTNWRVTIWRSQTWLPAPNNPDWRFCNSVPKPAFEGGSGGNAIIITTFIFIKKQQLFMLIIVLLS